MKTSIVLLATLLLPFGLSAQSTSAARKAAPATSRSSASRLPARPASARPAMTPTASPSAQANPAPAQAGAGQATPAVATPPTTAAVAITPAPATTPRARAAQPAPAARIRPISDREAEKGFRVGIRVGGSGATATGFDASELAGANVEPVMGFHGGLVLSFGKRAFTVQPEFLYSQYGFKIASGQDYAQLNYNVVEVPLLLKYTFGHANARFFVNLGPTATYLLGGKIAVRQGGETAEGDIEIDPNEGRFNYGGSVGVGVALKAGPGSFQLEARGTYLTTSDSNMALQGGKLSVAYLIPLGKN